MISIIFSSLIIVSFIIGLSTFTWFLIDLAYEMIKSIISEIIKTFNLIKKEFISK